MRDEKRRGFDASKIVRAYMKITLKEAMQAANSGKLFLDHEELPQKT